MSAATPSNILKTSNVHETVDFDLVPDAAARETMARALGIIAIKKLKFDGKVMPDGQRDLRLEAHLGTTVVQECVVTGAPVTTRIDEHITRRYLADMIEPEVEEMEMPDDETEDPLPSELDLGEVMAEAIALALPPWPRAKGVEPVDISVTEPGKKPMSEDDAKPFAGLKTLTQKAANDDGNTGDEND